MTNLSQAFDQEIQGLTRLRDEVRLQLHLAKAEARDAFDKLEARWPEVEQAVARAEAEANDGAKEVAEAARGLAQEMRLGYEEVYRKITKKV